MIRGPKSRTDEASLIDSARKGDRGSFDALANRHREHLRAFIKRRLTAGDVDDMIQESLIAAWRSMPAFEGRSGFKTWLCAIANYKLQDHYRRVKAPALHLESLTEEPSFFEPAFAQFELAESVRATLEALSPPKGAILEMYYGQRMTLAEVGRHLGINTSTVKYHFYHAHEAVAAALKAAGHS
jgi:RNA polymerase sigma-70 factor (ECF subfamily)